MKFQAEEIVKIEPKFVRVGHITLEVSVSLTEIQAKAIVNELCEYYGEEWVKAVVDAG